MLKSILKWARIRIIVSCYGLAFLGNAVAGSITPKTVLTFFIIAAFIIHANSINDYADKDIDAINLRNANDRPLVSRDISNRQFWFVHLASGIAMLLLSLAYGTAAAILSVGVIAINYLYSLPPIRVTDRTLTSPILLSATYVYFSFSLGFLSAGSGLIYPWALSVALFLGFVARMLLKDFRDVEGDKRHGKVTFLLRYGPHVTCLVSGVCWLAAMVVVGAVTSFSIGLIVPLTGGALLVFFWLQELSNSKHFNEQQNLVAVIAKAANFAVISMLAFYLCRVQPGLSSAETILLPAAIGTTLFIYARFYYLNFEREGSTQKS